MKRIILLFLILFVGLSSTFAAVTDAELYYSFDENQVSGSTIYDESDGTYNGTSTCVWLQQSNVDDQTDLYWHDVGFTQTLEANKSFLLHTDQFYCDYIRLKILKGDATAGILTIDTNYKD